MRYSIQEWKSEVEQEDGRVDVKAEDFSYLYRKTEFNGKARPVSWVSSFAWFVRGGDGRDGGDWLKNCAVIAVAMAHDGAITNPSIAWLRKRRDKKKKKKKKRIRESRSNATRTTPSLHRRVVTGLDPEMDLWWADFHALVATPIGC